MKSFNKKISLLLVAVMFSTFTPTKVTALADFNSMKQTEKTDSKKQKKEAKILKEVVEKREQSTKYFLRDDMSYEAVIYPQPVHYLDNGQWKDIDNSQVEVTGDIDEPEVNVDDQTTINSSDKGELESITEGETKETLENKDIDNNQVEANNNMDKPEVNVDEQTTINSSNEEDLESVVEEEAKGAFENKDNDFKVKVSKNSKASKLVSVKKGNYEISWDLTETNNVKANKISADSQAINALIEKTVDEEMAKDDSLKDATAEEKNEIRNIKIENEKKKTLINISSKIEFKGVYENVDLDYLIKGNELKENIIINEKLENPEFRFNLNVKNLIPKLDKNNVITFYDSKDNSKAVYSINAPYMYDANFQHSNNIKVILNQTKKGYELIVTPDKEWLNSATVKYPVTLDPSVETSQNVKNIRDSFVSSAFPYNNYQQAQLLEVGYGSASQRNWTYIKFDTLPTLSSSDMIIGANLYLLLSKAPSATTQVNAHRVTGSWDSSTITWNNAPGIDNTIKDYKTLDSTSSGWVNWDITSIGKEWYKSGNNGLVLKTENEYAGYTEFWSSDMDNTYSQYRPAASFYYISNAGLENYWTYHSMSAGRAGTAYVNDYNGNLVYVHDDLSMNGNLMPVQINHVYNSNEAKGGVGTKAWMGAGWSMNIYQRVENDTNNKTLIYIDGDGTKHYFSYAGLNTVYNVPDLLNLGYTITWSSSESRFTLKDKNYNTTKFYSDGSLDYFLDKNGNKLTAKYTQASNGIWTITGLVDGAGRTTKLLYNSTGILTQITDPAQRITTFAYDTSSNQKLIKITYPDGNNTVFDYDANYNLLAVTNNADGVKNKFWYTSYAPYRVNWIRNTHVDDTRGEDLSINYGNNRTDFTDVQGRTETYLFDNYGKTRVVKDSKDTAQYYKYSDGLNETKVGTESKTQATIVNYLLDHNAEYNLGWTSNNSGAAGYTTEEKYIGQQSLKINSSVDNQTYYNSQYIPLARGKTYTFSVYAKTKDIVAAQNGGASFEIQYLDSSQKWQVAPGKINLTGTKEWDRYEFTFTIPKDAYSTGNNLVNAWAAVEMINAKGTAYFDGMQIEEGTSANRYNLVENGDFRKWDNNTWHALYWNKEAGNEGKDVDYVAYDTNKQTHPKTLDVDVPVGQPVYKLQGKSGNKKGIYQTLNISGKAGDSYVIGGWAKADSVPLTKDLGRLFELSVGFEKADGTFNWVELPFNPDTSEWQYLSDAAVAKNDYKKIWVYACYYKNVNTVYFDGIQLYKDEFGSSYTYDSKGNVISTQSLAKQNSKFEYSDNDLVKQTDPKGSQFKYTYSTDGKHNLLSAASGENVVYSFEYDAKGNPKKSKVGDSTTFIDSYAEYSTSGNYIKSITDSSGNKVNYNYNETKGTLDTVIDPNGTTTSYQYDDKLDTLLNVKKTVDGKEILNSYTYEKDRLKTITHNGFSYTFGYDSLGNNTTVSVGNQNLITNTYGTYYNTGDSKYYQTGLLTQSQYGNGQIVKNGYDDSDRVISKTFNSQQFKYSYDANGNLGYHEDLVNQVNYKYSYDLSDRLTKVSDNKGNVLNYSFDANNNLSNIKDTISNGETITYSTDYSYDKDNRPTATAFSGGTLNNTYDPIGRLDTRSINSGANSFVTKYNYENVKEVDGVTTTTTKVSSIVSNGKSIGYTYDYNSNIKTITENNKVITYSYNELNELIREDNQVLDKTIVYSYDAGGNLQSKIEYPYTDPLIALSGAANTVSYTYGDANWKDKLTNFNGKDITYDAIGNPLTYDGYTYSWEWGRRLASMTGNGKTISYKYNDSGIRTQKTVNNITTNYHLVGDKVTYEDNGTDKIYYTYDSSDNLVSMNLNGVEYYYIRNAQGDIIGLFSKDGIQVASYIYDSWGKLISIKDTNNADITNDTGSAGYKNPYRYRGYRYDTETGLYYLQSRYYNPEWGRFINADTIVGEVGDLLSHNMFAYCNNDPVNMEDPDGDIAWWVGAAIGGALFDSAVYLFQHRNGGFSWSGLGKAAATGALTGVAFAGAGKFVAKGVRAIVSSRKAKAIAQAACFTEDTPVLTKDGSKPIKEVKVGDEVYSENPETGEKGLKKVTDVFVNETDKLIHLYVDGEEIKTTSEHPFWVVGEGWVGAEDLRAGDRVLLYSSKMVEIEQVTVEQLDDIIKVYNFEVEDWHTYFVSEKSVLVHNMCAAKKWDIVKYAKDSLKFKFQGKAMTAYMDKNGYWWAKDLAGHGNSAYKVYRKVGKTLQWVHDADINGNFIEGKFKGAVGKIIKLN